jgi:hypothetical protein
LAFKVPHIFPAAHFVRQAPPQSTSVSVPFFTVSVQVGVTQTPSAQTPLVQSLPVPQPLPLAHGFPGAHVPPQSTSVSVPFFTVSAQVGATQMWSAAGQTPSAQSGATAQALPVAHRGQVDPQSTSVSVPFLTASVQLGAWHRPPMQTPPTQSVPVTHILPAPHLPHPPVAPPQSMSVSIPFWCASPQVGATQTALVHTRLAQSPPPTHFLPAAHGAHDPPQFTSDSVPFLIGSMHDGAAQTPAVQTWLMQSDITRHDLSLKQGPHAAPPQSTSVSEPFLMASAQVAL